MKTFAFLILAMCVSAGCASSDKKSSASGNQATTTKRDSLIAKQFSSASDTSGLTEITGQLNYTGNEPFTKPAIFVSGTEMYVLKADEIFLEETFSALNGKRATIYGRVKKSENSAELEVHYYELKEN